MPTAHGGVFGAAGNSGRGDHLGHVLGSQANLLINSVYARHLVSVVQTQVAELIA
jgi:hypothetical protein